MPRKPPEGGFMHGSSGYDNYGCRCEICRKGNADKQKRLREMSRDERIEVGGVMIHPFAPHGTRNGYQYYKCRCEPCSEAAKK